MHIDHARVWLRDQQRVDTGLRQILVGPCLQLKNITAAVMSSVVRAKPLSPIPNDRCPGTCATNSR